MERLPPKTTRTDTPFPYTTLFRARLYARWRNDPADRGGGVRDGRNGHQGQGTAAGGVRHAAATSCVVHLSASGAGPEADPGADRIRLRGDRLRNGDGCAWRPAAAGTDERGRRAHVDPGGRTCDGESAGGQWRLARWRPRCAGCGSREDRK